MITSLDAFITDTCPAMRDGRSLGLWWTVESAKFCQHGGQTHRRGGPYGESYCCMTSMEPRASLSLGHRRQEVHSNSTRYVKRPSRVIGRGNR
jgi:hypothetical protein